MLRPLTTKELYSDNEYWKWDEFTKRIKLKLGSAMLKHRESLNIKSKFTKHEDDFEKPHVIPETEQPADKSGQLTNKNPEHRLINSKVTL